MNLKPEELVKALRGCSDLPTGNSGCAGCMFASLYEPACTDLLLRHAADQIERDQKEIEALRELAVADKDGRCVVLLCKVGDTVWLTRTWVSERLSQPEAAALTGAYICGNDVCTFVTNKYGFQQDKIGKNVFLTHEEAEKALAEMVGKKNGV